MGPVKPMTPNLDHVPWQDLPDAALGAALDVPSMISPEERRLYTWLTENWATGAGAIVDLGAFVGGSTACLAQGVDRAGRTTPVAAFDRFKATEEIKKRFLYPAGVGIFDGNETLALAHRLLEPWAPLIDLRQGDIDAATWEGGPIEILVIDAAKTALTADRIAETFFPHLIPGRSIVVHQDFLHWKLPWLPAQMEWLSACFEPMLHCAPETVVHRCTRAPNQTDLARGRIQQRRDRELIDALALTGARLKDWHVADRLATQTRAIRANPNARRAKDFVHRP